MSETNQDLFEQNQETRSPKGSFTTAEASAGFGVRLGAKIIDHLFIVLIAIPGAILGIIIVRSMGMQLSRTMDLDKTITYYTLGFVEFFLYFIIAESIGGVTIGKSKLGLHVVNEDFSSPNPIKILIRNLLYFIDASFFGLVAYLVMRSSSLQQRLGDMLARTVVVYDIQIPYENKLKLGSAKRANWLAALFLVAFETFRHILKYT